MIADRHISAGEGSRRKKRYRENNKEVYKFHNLNVSYPFPHYKNVGNLEIEMKGETQLTLLGVHGRNEK